MKKGGDVQKSKSKSKIVSFNDVVVERQRTSDFDSKDGGKSSQKEGVSEKKTTEEKLATLEKLSKNEFRLPSEEDEEEYGLLAELKRNIPKENLTAKSRLLADVTSQNYRLHKPGDAVPKPKVIDVTAAVQANPTAFDSHSSYVKLFSKADPDGTLNGITFSGTSQMLDAHFYFFPPFKHCENLDVSFLPNLTDWGVRLIVESFPQLKKINASGCRLVTETSLRLLSNRSLEVIFDMTSVRYLPTGLKFANLSLEGCPLMVQQEEGGAVAHAKLTKTSSLTAESLQSVYSFIKVVVIKPDSMKSQSIATEWLKPNGNIIGPQGYVTCYRSGPYRVFECTRQAPIQLFLTNNCLVILPFAGDGSDLALEYQSVESRFCFVSSLLVNFQAIAVPIFTKPATKSLDKTQIGLMKSEQAKSAKGEQSSSEKEKRQPESNPRIARRCHFLVNNLTFLPTAATVVEWLSANKPHTALPLSVLNLFDQLTKSSLFKESGKPFIKIGLLPRIHHWSSFVEILSETGNCWLERYVGYDGPSPGPSHFMMSMPNFIKLIETVTSAKDLTAGNEDIRCMPSEVPLCSVERIRTYMSNSGLSCDEVSRILLEFELAGLGVFTQNRLSAVAFTNLPEEPHLPPNHFIAELANQNISLTYPLICEPKMLIFGLISTLSKVQRVVLLWKNGAIFQESATLAIHVKCVDTGINVELIYDDQHSQTTKNIMKGSCSLIHTICARLLQPFSTDDLSSLGESAVVMHTPGPVSHLVYKLDPEKEAIRTFTREFDLTKPRCLRCLSTDETLAILRRLHLGAFPNLHKMSDKLSPSRDGRAHLVAKIPLTLIEPTNFVEILTVTSIKTAIICLNDLVGGLFVRVTISNTDHLEADFQLVEEEAVKQANNAVRLPNCPLRICAFLREGQEEGSAIVVIRLSVGGFQLFEASIKGDAISSISHFNLYVEPNKQSVLYTYTRGDEVPSPIRKTFFTTNREIKPGMILEVLSKKDAKLRAASVVKCDSENGTVLVKLLPHDSEKDEVAETDLRKIGEFGLFPVGFSQFLSSNKILFERFKNLTKLKWNFDLTYNKMPAKWLKPEHFLENTAKNAEEHNLFGEDEEISVTFDKLEHVPYKFFEKSLLLGFPPNFLENAEKKQCLESLSMRLWLGLKDPDLADLKKRSSHLKMLARRGLIYIGLPYPLSWQKAVWPSPSIVSSFLLPNFLCLSKGLMHFVNEAPSYTPDADFSAGEWRTDGNAAPLHSFLAILKMMEQPHFIPDKSDRIFPEFVKPCPFNYSSIVSKEKEDNRAKIERLFRNAVFPFLLDYNLFHIVQLGLDVPKLVAKSGSSGYKRCVGLYEKFLRNERGELVIMPWSAAEFDYYHQSEDCPYAMCAKHTFHCSEYERRKRCLGSSNNDGNSGVAGDDDKAAGSSYDSLMTTYVRTVEDINTPIATKHPYITDIYMGACQLKSLPVDTFRLRFLNELILRENSLSNLPDELASLKPTLQLLDLSLNDFQELPTVVYQLTELRSLRADLLTLTSLSPKIGELSHLILLSFRSNCLKKIPPEIAKLTHLQFLDLSGLPLFPLSMQYIEEAGGFLEKNHFPQEASSVVSQLLSNGGNLSTERIELLNEHIFVQLPRLELSSDGFLFPQEILSFREIRELSLAYQPIVEVPDQIGKMTQLRRFDLSGCLRLKTISPQISSSPLEMLSLNNCPLLSTPPAEIRKRGFAATTAFFRRLAQGSVNVQRTKLMFVGLGGAGKTSLVNAIVSKTNKVGKTSGGNSLPVTDGIDITDWEMTTAQGSNKVSFRLWDFAGQVVYYNTHQFFLSNRAVYLIMWNIRLGHEHAGIDFWLSSIAVHAPNCPVFVVGTHADQVPEERSFLPELAYRERFSSICGFHYVSSHTGAGIDALRQQILEVALKQKHMGEAIPAAWLTFEQKLTDKKGSSKTESSVVMLSDVVKIADSSGIYEEDELDQALQFFTDLGSIQYFKTDFLRDRVIINPQWIVDVMASLVSVKDSPLDNGRLFHKDLALLWKDYPSPLIPWLLKLTEAFDLTFPLKGKPESIVPCMLPENAPVDINWPSLEDHPDWRQTELILQFKYLPTGLFNRAQVRLCQLSDTKIWRRGSLLHKNKHLALISQPDTTSVHVKVQGPRPENISFLILEVFDGLINESFHGIFCEYLFSCPECVNVRASQPSMFERSRIRRATELHIPVLQCYHFFHQIPTRELRQLLPAENTVDFDFQLSRTVQQLNGIITQSFENDVVVVGNANDLLGETKNFTNANEIAGDLQKSLVGMKVVLVNDPDSTSFDQISLLIRSARLIICCISPNFAASETCVATALYARESLRKPLLVVLVREIDIKANDSLNFFLGDQVYVKAITRAKYKPNDVAEQAKRRINEFDRSIKHPAVFISYCWQNSQDAVEKGTKPREGSVGVTDPRALKKHLVEYCNVDCWLDIEQVGRNGLFEDIAVGLRHARVVVVCISDEYVASSNCIREFRFATSACALPVILCVVGTGMAWKTSEVSLVVPPSSQLINFQVESKANYEKLVTAVKQYVTKNEKSASSSKPSLSSIGRMKTMDDIKQAEKPPTSQVVSNQEAATLIFQEMRELEQRRFLRQLCEYADNTKPYPRLIFIDASLKEETPASEDDTIFCKFQWCVRFFCEHEEGWHPTETKFSLSGENVGEIIQKSAGYLGRLFSLLEHSANNGKWSPLILTQEPLFQTALKEIEKMVKFEESFEADYTYLLELAISLDENNASYGGGLRHCQLAIGKELWLCSQHESSGQYRLKGKATTVEQVSSDAVVAGDIDKNCGFLGVSLALEHKPLVFTGSDADYLMTSPRTAAVEKGPSKLAKTASNTSNNSKSPTDAPIKRDLDTQVKTSRACILQ